MFNQLISLLALPVVDGYRFDFPLGEMRITAVLLVFGVLAYLETRIGRRQVPTNTIRRSYLANLYTLIFNDALMSLLSVSSLLVVAERYGGTGLLSQIPSPLLKTVASFILLDLTLYLWHRANHCFEWLWMFHKVHHSDLHMNVSTAFRLHCIEVVLTTLVKAVFIVALGIDTVMLLANETLITFCVMFHHSNIAVRGEKLLGSAIIVPYLHRVHHSARREEHDSNYGAFFSCWDRLFGTLAEREPAKIGLKNLAALNFIALIKYGFSRATSAASPTTHCLETMIAEAAYYKAEKRRFAPGNDLRDWLEAEKEIAAQFMRNRRQLFQ